eukprot:11065-Karenia_brevis.AAC.1
MAHSKPLNGAVFGKPGKNVLYAPLLWPWAGLLPRALFNIYTAQCSCLRSRLRRVCLALLKFEKTSQCLGCGGIVSAVLSSLPSCIEESGSAELALAKAIYELLNAPMNEEKGENRMLQVDSLGTHVNGASGALATPKDA